MRKAGLKKIQGFLLWDLSVFDVLIHLCDYPRRVESAGLPKFRAIFSLINKLLYLTDGKMRLSGEA